jgi:hypothetical protein
MLNGLPKRSYIYIYYDTLIMPKVNHVEPVSHSPITMWTEANFHMFFVNLMLFRVGC